MKTSVLTWLGAEFVHISCEAREGKTAAEQGKDVFAQARAALAIQGLSSGDTVRSRVFGVDRAARDAVSQARFAALQGNDRAASSSYIAPKRFSSDALVALDLIAIRPRPGIVKVIRDYAPPRSPICSVELGPLVFLSGNTSERATLEAQLVGDILPRIRSYLQTACSDWRYVVNVDCYLHESQSQEKLRECYVAVAGALPARFEICFDEGFSLPGKLVEVEVTAQRVA